jgi:hypothetical protein
VRRHRLLVLLGVGGVAFSGFSALGAIHARADETTRYVSTTGTDNATCSKTAPCQHIQHAVDIATAGDTVSIAKGTYVEQVLVAKDLTFVGAGIDETNIKGPDIKNFDSYGKTYIVEVTSGATLTATKLTVRGPSGLTPDDCGPNPLSLDMGVAAINKATLTMYQAAVRDIYDHTLTGDDSGCQRGDAVSIGKPGGVDPSMAVAAHGNLFGVVVTRYQRTASLGAAPARR